MRMDANTTLEHLPQFKAGFYTTRWGGRIVLFTDPMQSNTMIVADFDCHGYCTNASSFIDYAKAWRFFMEIVTLDLDGKSDPPHDYAPPLPDEDDSLERAFLRDLRT